MNNMEWMKKESAQWVADGIITPEQRTLIELRYPAERAGSPLLLLFAILGSLLVGTGIVLVFATNWWRLSVEVKIALAVLPLAVAQLIGLFVFMRKRQSAPFREGGAVFLSLAFFAAVALMGQAFHTPSDLSSYVLLCVLFTLPGVYFFRGRAAAAIYVAGAVFAVWSWPMWVAIVLAGLVLPFFWLELRATSHRGAINYLLFLLCALLSGTVIQVMRHEGTALEIALVCGLVMLLLDVLLRKFGSDYFFNAAKLLAILCVTGTLLIASLDFSYREAMSTTGLLFAAGVAAAYAAVRYLGRWRLMASDLFAGAAVLLILAQQALGAAASLLVLALGIFYIVQGSRALALNKLNFGMGLVVLLIGIRFFDSNLDLLGRGIVFILLGGALLGINVHISRKRRGRSE